jgi:hypothetical protein
VTTHREISSLDELADLVTDWRGKYELYVRWTKDVERDAHAETSRDELTGLELPGLSVNSLRVEPWWGERSKSKWVARRLYDYRHLPEIRGPETRPWVVTGEEIGRGPDNEPLICRCEPIAAVALSVIEAAQDVVRELGDDWGSLRRD